MVRVRRVVTRELVGLVPSRSNRATGQHVGEVGFGIGPGFYRCGQVREAILSLKRGEQGTGEGPVRVRQCHQHEMATGPDVQGFGIDAKSPSADGGIASSL